MTIVGESAPRPGRCARRARWTRRSRSVQLLVRALNRSPRHASSPPRSRSAATRLALLMPNRPSERSRLSHVLALLPPRPERSSSSTRPRGRPKGRPLAADRRRGSALAGGGAAARADLVTAASGRRTTQGDEMSTHDVIGRHPALQRGDYRLVRRRRHLASRELPISGRAGDAMSTSLGGAGSSRRADRGHGAVRQGESSPSGPRPDRRRGALREPVRPRWRRPKAVRGGTHRHRAVSHGVKTSTLLDGGPGNGNGLR